MTVGTFPRSLRAASEADRDRELVRRFNEGDDSAFTEIVSHYYPKLLAVARKALRNDGMEAQEVTQDAFIRAYRGLKDFRGDSSLATWLHRININLARNRYWYHSRRKRDDTMSIDARVATEAGHSLEASLPDGAPDPAQIAGTTELAAIIAECMEGLDGPQREILVLRNVQNLSYEEISEILGISFGTVKSRIARARQSLRRLLVEACTRTDLAEDVLQRLSVLRPYK